MENFLCQMHSEHILTRNISNIQCKEAKSHLYKTLYLRHTEEECEESILAANAAIREHQKAYIK